MEPISIIIGAVIGLLVGGGGAYFMASGKTSNAVAEAEAEASKILGKANQEAKQVVEAATAKGETIKEKRILQAKEKYLKLKSDYRDFKEKEKEEIKGRELKIRDKENRYEQRNEALNQKYADLNKERQEMSKDIKAKEKQLDVKLEEIDNRHSEIDTLKNDLQTQLEAVANRKAKVAEQQQEVINKLEQVSQMTEEEARKEVLAAVKAKSETQALAVAKRITSEAKANATRDAKKIIMQTIMRMAGEITIENTVSVFNLPSDDMKGQIIGREGRNIRALEAATGTELIVDDTPEAIVISSYDAVRREVCRLSLQRLVADGRIHPSHIEEVVTKTRKELEERIMEIGERTVIDLDIHGLAPALVRMVGRMRFRSSYGQNLLKHSIETAQLCGLMAAEMQLSKVEIKMARRAGLLHDIGKVADEDTELSHALYGMKLCEAHGEKPAICNAVGAHHEEIEMTHLISPVVQACDAISGARPGARRETLQSYLNRIKEMENLATGYDGVLKAYAMQAGRELRVIVDADNGMVTDSYASDLSMKISEQIQDEMQYPGQVHVVVIREKRAVSIAR